MDAERLKLIVNDFETFPAYIDAINSAEEAREARPPKDTVDANWLRAQADLLDEESRIEPATRDLQVEVAQASDLIDLPERLGLLSGLNRYIDPSRRSKQRDYSFLANFHYPGDSKDLKMEDYKHGSNDPYRFAEQIGGDIREVEEKLPRFSKTVPAAIIKIGYSRKPAYYTQPTAVTYYKMAVPPKRKLGNEPEIIDSEDSKTVKFSMPRLEVVEGIFNYKRKQLDDVPYEQILSVGIPNVEMRHEDSYEISPRKLLIGAEVAKFAAKHAIDTETERRRQRRLREEDLRNSRIRY